MNIHLNPFLLFLIPIPMNR